MKSKDLVIVGTGGHSKVLIDIIEATKHYNIVGFTAKEKGITNFAGYPVLGDDFVLKKYLDKGVKYAAIGVGGFKDNNLRKEIYHRIKALGFELATLIHPSCSISKSVKIEDGVVIFRGVCINNDVKIGSNTIVCTGSTIDHETVLGAHILISAGVTIGANTVIEDGVLCALGSKIISGITIRENILIGAGAVVVKDLNKKGTYIGCPAKINI